MRIELIVREESVPRMKMSDSSFCIRISFLHASTAQKGNEENLATRSWRLRRIAFFVFFPHHTTIGHQWHSSFRSLPYIWIVFSFFFFFFFRPAFDSKKSLKNMRENSYPKFFLNCKSRRLPTLIPICGGKRILNTSRFDSELIYCAKTLSINQHQMMSSPT